jgi:hypothetical protein
VAGVEWCFVAIRKSLSARMLFKKIFSGKPIAHRIFFDHTGKENSIRERFLLLGKGVSVFCAVVLFLIIWRGKQGDINHHMVRIS